MHDPQRRDNFVQRKVSHTRGKKSTRLERKMMNMCENFFAAEFGCFHIDFSIDLLLFLLQSSLGLFNK